MRLITYLCRNLIEAMFTHDDVVKWKHFPRNWLSVRGIHRSPVNSPHKGQWRVALMFSLICVSINGWVNNREAGDLRHYHGHYEFTLMKGAITVSMSVGGDGWMSTPPQSCQIDLVGSQPCWQQGRQNVWRIYTPATSITDRNGCVRLVSSRTAASYMDMLSNKSI